MKRDWDLIRRILTQIEENDTATLEDMPEDDPRWVYQILMMTEENLIYGLLGMDSMSAPPIVQQTCGQVRLTSKGHDLLESMRSNDLWNSTKNKATEIGSGLTAALIVALARVRV